MFRELSLEISMHPGTPPGYVELSPQDVTVPGRDIYINGRGTWSISKSANPVGAWTTFCRHKDDLKEFPLFKARKAIPREVPARKAKLRA